ncbi:MAG TPA: efflux RND transporter periplasmic adaptor subunit [Thermoanaerobaculia bacterium]|nr:efflux RND transporter periplasmic adaptor subunit [Thermoanaerobaculia bacterium]
MKRNRLITIIVLVLLAAAAALTLQRASAREAQSYRFGELERGDIRRTVSATGTLNAVTTVSVGTQVSGQVADLHVDFNDRVKKGQILARIDPRLAQQAVTDAEATLERNRAQLIEAQREYKRNGELLQSGLVARSAFDSVESSLAVARANVKSAQVAVDRARQNLSYTTITAPIDGVVVERNVDLGQTVAASLSAPQLFLIAEDLSNMQILVKVDESDIALIKQGQPVSFTVQALQRDTFKGIVKQVRLQSTTQENVVSYTVVIEVDNRDGKLLPGLTASVDFLVNSADNVLTVPNAALRFAPEATASSAATPTTTGQTPPSRRRSTSRGGRSIYTVDAKGQPKAIAVRTGITDGTRTEVSGEGLQEGMKIITGVVQTTAGGAPSAAPLGGQQQQGGRRGGF